MEDVTEVLRCGLPTMLSGNGGDCLPRRQLLGKAGLGVTYQIDLLPKSEVIIHGSNVL